MKYTAGFAIVVIVMVVALCAWNLPRGLLVIGGMGLMAMLHTIYTLERSR